MDYRERKYYLVTFKGDSYNSRIQQIRSVVPSFKIHEPYNHKKEGPEEIRRGKVYDGSTIGIAKVPEGQVSMKYWQVMVSCKNEDATVLEKELKKAANEDVGPWWDSSFYMKIDKKVCGQ